jgi:hypothetical protein
MHLFKGGKSLIIAFCLLILLGVYAWYYQWTIHRVQDSVEAENNMHGSSFYKNKLRYEDLSRTVREVITEKEFESWSTWKDVDNSFTKLPRPNDDESDYVFQIPLEIGMAYVHYQLSPSGLKLRYVDVVVSDILCKIESACEQNKKPFRSH